MTIKLVTLEGCGRCENLKSRMLKERINYYFTTCEENPGNCDNLEALVGEANYPMILLTNSSGAIFEVLFIANSYERLSEGAKNSGDILCIPNHSIDNMIIYVKNKLNLK